MTPPLDPPVNLEAIRAVLAGARAEGRTTLLEPEGLAILAATGITVPRWRAISGGPDVDDRLVDDLRGDRVVVKVVSQAITHKTDVGGVAVVARTRGAITAAVEDMRARLGGAAEGFTIAEFVAHDADPGGELLLSLRWTDDFGPVLSVGAGGILTEALSADLRPGREIAIVSPALRPAAGIASALAATTAVRLATTSLRGKPPRTSPERIAEVAARLLALAPLVPAEMLECEVNPAAVTADGLVALDVLVTLPQAATTAGADFGTRAARPMDKVERLLEPRSIAIVGVSSGMNAGRVILGNILRGGFNPADVVVVKPGATEIDGVRCVPDLGAIPSKVDLFVVVLPAAHTPAFVAEVVERNLAESLIVISGGLEEKEGGAGLTAPMRSALEAARTRPDGGPVINGGNCLGIRSRPGRYDTLFIPHAKLPPGTVPAPIALVTGSGAFAITRLSRLAPLDPRYVVTIGNQMDLTAGDVLTYLAGDPEVRTVGVYVEGFSRLDGLRFVEAAARVTASGRTVVMYRAGRTAAGVSSSAGHTAAIAGDVTVSRELARAAGVTVADTPAEFDDLLRTFAMLDGRPAAGRRLGAASNAGSECVTIADHAGSLGVDRFAPETEERLASILVPAGIGSVVDIRNPLDLTPIGRAATVAGAWRVIIDADETDVGILGLVPMADTIDTLPAGPGHGEDMTDPAGIAAELARLWRQTGKPWACVVDAGPLYSPWADHLRASGIPVLATADAAARVLAAWCDATIPRA